LQVQARCFRSAITVAEASMVSRLSWGHWVSQRRARHPIDLALVAFGATIGVVCTLLLGPYQHADAPRGSRRLDGGPQEPALPATCALDSLLGVSHPREQNMILDDVRRLDVVRAQLGRRAPIPATRLVKHPASKSLLQDVLVRAMTVLNRLHLLPLSSFGKKRCGTPGRGQVCRGRGIEDQRDDLVDRRQLQHFFDEFAALAVTNATCLEWDRPTYLSKLRKPDGSHACARVWALKYKEGRTLNVVPRSQEAHGDLARLEHPGAAGSLHEQIDFALCNMVFEHVSQPAASARGLFQLMRPGGIVLFSVPFVSIYHGPPLYRDQYRYTVDGAANLMRTAGFKVLKQLKLGNGVLAAAGYLLGFGMGDYEEEDLLTDMLVVDSPQNISAAWMSSALVLQRPLL